MERKPNTAAVPRPSLEEDPAAAGGPSIEETRRLQRMGSVTIGVSLPREWVGRRGLVVGSPVRLRALADGSIILHDRASVEVPRATEIQVRLDRSREHLFRRLVAAYLAGAQEFNIEEPGGLSAETRSVARAFARRTIQPEIVYEEGDRLLLRDVSRGGDLDIVPLLRRMNQVVQRLHEEAGATFHAGVRPSTDDWSNRDDEVDRHAWLIERILALRVADSATGTVRSMPFATPLQVLVVVRSLERAADHAVQIAEHGARWMESSPPSRVVRGVSEFHAQVRRLLAESFTVAEAGDSDRANDVLDTGEALHSNYHTLVESTLTRRAPAAAPTASAELSLVLQSIDRTSAYAQDIAEAGLDSGVGGRFEPRLHAVLPSSSSTHLERGGMRKR